MPCIQYTTIGRWGGCRRHSPEVPARTPPAYLSPRTFGISPRDFPPCGRHRSHWLVPRHLRTSRRAVATTPTVRAIVKTAVRKAA